MSAVTWKSGPDSYDANVDIELSSAGGETFVFKTGQAQYLHETSLLSLDATIKQANSADVGINLGMRCDNVAGSMYPEQVVAGGVTRSKGGDNSQDTKFCTGSVELMEGSSTSYSLNVEKAAFDVEGDGGGVELASHGTIFGDYVELDLLIGWNALYEIHPVQGYSYDYDDDSYDDDSEEWFEQPQYDMSSYMPNWQRGSMQSVDLFHTLKFVSRSGEKFEITLEPTIQSATSGFECKGTITNGGTTYGMDMDMGCDNSEGGMYLEQVVADGATRTFPRDQSTDTTFCVGSLDLTMNGADEYTFNVKKAAVDFNGPAGGLKLESTGTIAGDPIKLDIEVGWSQVSEIVQTSQLGSTAVGRWYEQERWGQSGQIWDYDGASKVNLFHTITYSSPGNEKFELSTQPTINLLSGGFNADVPATLELEGEQYKVDASINCAEVNSPKIGDGSEYGCKNIDLSVKSDGKVRVSADLGKVVINVGADGAVAIEGEVLADDQMHSVSTDIQWIDNYNAGTFEVKRMHASVTQVPDLSQRTRRASANVFVMDGDMFIDFETDGITDFLNKMEMSMSMEMETSATKRVSLAFGDKSFEPTEETIAVVDMDSTSEYTAGQTTLKVPDVSNVRVGDYLFIGKGASQQKVRVTAVSRADGTVTLETELKDTHEIGTKLSFQSGSFGDVAPISKSSASSTYCSAIFALAAVVTATMV